MLPCSKCAVLLYLQRPLGYRAHAPVNNHMGLAIPNLKEEMEEILYTGPSCGSPHRGSPFRLAFGELVVTWRLLHHIRHTRFNAFTVHYSTVCQTLLSI